MRTHGDAACWPSLCSGLADRRLVLGRLGFTSADAVPVTCTPGGREAPRHAAQAPGQDTGLRGLSQRGVGGEGELPAPGHVNVASGAGVPVAPPPPIFTFLVSDRFLSLSL